MKEAVWIAMDGVGGDNNSGKYTIRENFTSCSVVQLDDVYSPALKAADIVRLKEQVFLPLDAKREAKYQYSIGGRKPYRTGIYFYPKEYFF
ncbi:MAG: hypothetical protein JW748_13370 [Anaerolineales bacterium]|nr:hypothetical protein [Anaerolineales bacterium]